MNHLLRSLAPISDAGWELLDGEAKARVAPALAVRKLVDGPLAYAPGLDGAVLVSLRGGDFLFESGEDISIGYDHHDELIVRLYLQESFSFRVATPEAAVAFTLNSA
jgi:uncharacterized linocin/CFP29 family protein